MQVLYGFLSDSNAEVVNTFLNLLMFVVVGGGASQLPRVIRKNSTDPVVDRLDRLDQTMHTVQEEMSGLTTRVGQLERKVPDDG